jgi:AcrR family transcriptional regulator
VTNLDSAVPSDIQTKREKASAASRRVYSRRRQTIISAAAEVFYAKGLAHTNLVDISDKLGVDRASLYYYFKDKHELFRTVILESIGSLIDQVNDIVEQPAESNRAKLVDVYTLVIRGFADHYPTLHIYLQEDMEKMNKSDIQVDPESLQLARLAETYMTSIETLIRDGVAAGEFRTTGDPGVVALLLQGSINWMHRWYEPLEGPPAAEIARTMVDLAIDGLAPTHVKRGRDRSAS